jgi:hypothetical protein
MTELRRITTMDSVVLPAGHLRVVFYLEVEKLVDSDQRPRVPGGDSDFTAFGGILDCIRDLTL